jgi:hypothetical protein
MDDLSREFLTKTNESPDAIDTCAPAARPVTAVAALQISAIAAGA